MSDIVERLRVFKPFRFEGGEWFGPKICIEAADEIQSLRQRVERLEGGFSDLIQSCSRTAVGSGDGGTFVVGPPEHGALMKASALLHERQ